MLADAPSLDAASTDSAQQDTAIDSVSVNTSVVDASIAASSSRTLCSPVSVPPRKFRLVVENKETQTGDLAEDGASDYGGPALSTSSGYYLGSRDECKALRSVHHRIRQFVALLQLWMESPSSFDFVGEWAGPPLPDSVSSFYREQAAEEDMLIAAMKEELEATLRDAQATQETKVNKLKEVSERQRLVFLRRAQRIEASKALVTDNIKKSFERLAQGTIEDDAIEENLFVGPTSLGRSCVAMLTKLFVFLKNTLPLPKTCQQELTDLTSAVLPPLVPLFPGGQLQRTIYGLTSGLPASLDKVVLPRDFDELKLIMSGCELPDLYRLKYSEPWDFGTDELEYLREKFLKQYAAEELRKVQASIKKKRDEEVQALEKELQKTRQMFREQQKAATLESSLRGTSASGLPRSDSATMLGTRPSGSAGAGKPPISPNVLGSVSPPLFDASVLHTPPLPSSAVPPNAQDGSHTARSTRPNTAQSEMASSTLSTGRAASEDASNRLRSAVGAAISPNSAPLDLGAAARRSSHMIAPPIATTTRDSDGGGSTVKEMLRTAFKPQLQHDDDGATDVSGWSIDDPSTQLPPAPKGGGGDHLLPPESVSRGSHAAAAAARANLAVSTQRAQQPDDDGERWRSHDSMMHIVPTHAVAKVAAAASLAHASSQIHAISESIVQQSQKKTSVRASRAKSSPLPSRGAQQTPSEVLDHGDQGQQQQQPVMDAVPPEDHSRSYHASLQTMEDGRQTLVVSPISPGSLAPDDGDNSCAKPAVFKPKVLRRVVRGQRADDKTTVADPLADLAAKVQHQRNINTTAAAGSRLLTPIGSRSRQDNTGTGQAPSRLATASQATRGKSTASALHSEPSSSSAAAIAEALMLMPVDSRHRSEEGIADTPLHEYLEAQQISVTVSEQLMVDAMLKSRLHRNLMFGDHVNPQEDALVTSNTRTISSSLSNPQTGISNSVTSGAEQRRVLADRQHAPPLSSGAHLATLSDNNAADVADVPTALLSGVRATAVPSLVTSTTVVTTNAPVKRIAPRATERPLSTPAQLTSHARQPVHTSSVLVGSDDVQPLATQRNLFAAQHLPTHVVHSMLGHLQSRDGSRGRDVSGAGDIPNAIMSQVTSRSPAMSFAEHVNRQRHGALHEERIPHDDTSPADVALTAAAVRGPKPFPVHLEQVKRSHGIPQTQQRSPVDDDPQDWDGGSCGTASGQVTARREEMSMLLSDRVHNKVALDDHLRIAVQRPRFSYLL